MVDTAQLLKLIDGHAVDIWTLGIAFVVMMIRPVRRMCTGRKPYFTRLAAMVDFMNGVVIIPFLLLIFAAISQTLLEEVIKTNKIFLAVAGVIGLIFVLGEVMSTEDKNH